MFARDDDGVTTTDDSRPDWPFGPFLKQAIDASGMSQRRVATAARISEGRLRQLITGYQKSGAMRIPISTTTTTVHALASVLDFDIYEGLTLAGLEASIPSAQRRAEMDEGLQDSNLPQPNPDLAVFGVEELLREVDARFARLESQLMKSGSPGQWIEFGQDAPVAPGKKLVATEPELEAMTPRARAEAQREFNEMVERVNKRDVALAARRGKKQPSASLGDQATAGEESQARDDDDESR